MCLDGTDLQDEDQIRQHQSVHLWQFSHNLQSTIRIGIAVDTTLVEVVWNQRFVQLPVPEFQQRSQNVRISAVSWRNPLVTPRLQGIHLIRVSRNPAQQTFIILVYDQQNFFEKMPEED